MRINYSDYDQSSGILNCYAMTEEEEKELDLFDKWIEANEVEDIDFEEIKIGVDIGIGKDVSVETTFIKNKDKLEIIRYEIL